MTVPLLPGVPPLPFGVGVIPSPVTILTADSPFVLGQADAVIWGIFDQDGNAVVTGDSVRAFDFSNDYEISDYPVEDGGFYSYNKVATPFDARLVFMQGGDVDARAAFLDSLRTTLADINLYTVVTPEIQYDLANIVGVRYRRVANEGATLLSVEVRVREVRQVASSEFSSTAAPDGAAQQDDGTIVADTPTQASVPATGDSPGLIQGNAPQGTVGVTNSSGNIAPAGTAPDGSIITYVDDVTGDTKTATVTSPSFIAGTTQLVGYNLTDGSHVGLGNVTSITVAGAKQVQ